MSLRSSSGRASKASGSMTSPSRAGMKVKPSSVFTSARPRWMAFSFTASSAWSCTFSDASEMAWTFDVYASEVKITGKTVRRSSMNRAIAAFSSAPRPGGNENALGRCDSSKFWT